MTDDNHTFISVAQARALYKPKRRAYPKEVQLLCGSAILAILLKLVGVL